MEYFRSQSMKFYHLIMPVQSTWFIMDRLGRLNSIHVLNQLADENTKSLFSQNIKKCNQLLIKISQMQQAINSKGIILSRLNAFQHKQSILHNVYAHWDKQFVKCQNPINKFAYITERVNRKYDYYNQLIKNKKIIQQKIIENTFHLALHSASQKILGSSFPHQYQQQNKINIRYIPGILERSQIERLKKSIFRISKGNAHVQLVQFNDIGLNNSFLQNKVMYFIIYQSGQYKSMVNKLQKMVITFSGRIFKIPHYREQIKELKDLSKQKSKLLQLTSGQQQKLLQQLSQIQPQISLSLIQTYKIYILKQKQLYKTINKFTIQKQFIHAFIWIPQKFINIVQLELDRFVKQHRQVPPCILEEIQQKKYAMPPTYYITNQYTYPSQIIVETYGISRYKQANPALFTLITFPFLFGVMFGDIGHGLLLFLFGLFLIIKFKELNKTILEVVLPFRYFIGLMGLFSIYCGLIYNQFLSIPLDIFGSCYDVPQRGPSLNTSTTIYPRQNCVYVCGIDPGWARAQNYLTFVNSFKMKISVILGVLQMSLGICIKATNNIYYGKFLPQLTFMIILFGYMDFLIVFKWLTQWVQPTQAPSIITTMINIPLKLGRTSNQTGGGAMWGNYESSSQNLIQQIILLVSIICIPLMLFPKPIYQKLKTKQAQYYHNKQDYQNQSQQSFD